MELVRDSTESAPAPTYVERGDHLELLLAQSQEHAAAQTVAALDAQLHLARRNHAAARVRLAQTTAKVQAKYGLTNADALDDEGKILRGA